MQRTTALGNRVQAEAIWVELIATVSSLAHIANEMACACQARCGGSTRDFCCLEELFELGSDGYKSTAVVSGIYFH